MSDSDAEFEKFLRESISSSGSYMSQLGASHMASVLKNDASLSDQELEAAGKSWLKSTNLHRSSLQITLPSIGENGYDYSKDSLDASNGARKSDSSSTISSTDASSGITESEQQYQPGLDTLEEKADKERFFEELEQGKDTPINYSELNRGLSETGRTSALTSSLSASGKLEEDVYKDDFESPSEESASSSASTVVPSEQNADMSETDVEVANEGSTQFGFTLSPIHSSDVQSSSPSNKSHSRSSDVSTNASNETELRSPRKSAVKNVSVRSDDKDQKLLKKEESKTNILSQELTESSNSRTSSRLNDSEDQSQVVPLAPIPKRDSSNDVKQNVNSEILTTEVGVLKSLDAGQKVPGKITSREVSGGKSEVQDATGLSTTRSDSLTLKQNDNEAETIHSRAQKLTDMPSSSSLTAKDVDLAVDSLTAVSADLAVSSEMIELQKALAAAGLPQMTNAKWKSGTSTHIGPTDRELLTKNTDGGGSTVGKSRVSAHPQKDSTYTKQNLQDVVRVIATQELANVSKEILEGGSIHDPPTPSVGKVAHKMKKSGPAELTKATKDLQLKPKQLQSKKMKKVSPFSSGRESPMPQAPRDGSSFRKLTVKVSGKAYSKKSKFNSRGKENLTPSSRTTRKLASPKQARKQTTKLSNKALQVPSSSPKYVQTEQRDSHPVFDHETESIARDGLEKVLVEDLSADEGSLKLTAIELELMKLQHEREITELKQELFSQSVKLKDLEMAKDSRKLLASGKDPNMLISHEEKEALKREIIEQEVLLQGYQKENERLCADLNSQQKECKANQTRLYQENQRLASQLANAKQQLESQIHRQRQEAPPSQYTESAELGSARISQLEDCLERETSEKRDLQNQVKQLKHLTHTLEQEAKSMKLKNKELEISTHDRVSKEVLDKLKTKHSEEITQLKEKLNKCTEKLKKLENVSELLKSKEAEIIKMKDRLESLESLKTKPVLKSVPKSGPKSEAKRVQQLQKQVKDLEKVIQKKFPNSLSALVLAANSSTVVEQETSAQLRVKELEDHVKELKSLLETAEIESVRKYEELEQKYTELQVKYEQQKASLSTQQSSSSQKTEETGSSQSLHQQQSHIKEDMIHSLPNSHEGKEHSSDKEVSDMVPKNEFLREKLAEVNSELVQLQGKLAEAEKKVSLGEEATQKKLNALHEEHQAKVDSLLAKFARDHSQLEVYRLHSQLKAKEATVIHLREKIECLEFERNQLSASKVREENLTKQLKETTEELLEARRNHTPEMHHFMMLRSKIAGLEERNKDFEAKNKMLWQNMMHSVSEASIKEMEHKWRLQLLAKNAEIEQYREEVDSLLAALKVLQQGNSL